MVGLTYKWHLGTQVPVAVLSLRGSHRERTEFFTPLVISWLTMGLTESLTGPQFPPLQSEIMIAPAL